MMSVAAGRENPSFTRSREWEIEDAVEALNPRMGVAHDKSSFFCNFMVKTRMIPYLVDFRI